DKSRKFIRAARASGIEPAGICREAIDRRGGNVRRRDLLVVSSAAMLSWPRAGEAQNRPWRLCLLCEGPDAVWDALRRGLAANGVVEGSDFVVDIGRAGGNYDLIPKIAQKLVGDGADVIVASGNTATRAVKAATTTVPIVMIVGADPVEEGL